MRESVRTERLLALLAHLVSFIALLPYFAGITLIPAAPVWTVGLAFNSVIALLSWKRSAFVLGHAAQAILLILAAYLTEFLALLFFIIASLFGIPINMTNGTLMQGQWAGVNPEVLIRVALAPLFLVIPFYRAYTALRGRKARMRLLGAVARYMTTRVR